MFFYDTHVCIQQVPVSSLLTVKSLSTVTHVKSCVGGGLNVPPSPQGSTGMNGGLIPPARQVRLSTQNSVATCMVLRGCGGHTVAPNYKTVTVALFTISSLSCNSTFTHGTEHITRLQRSVTSIDTVKPQMRRYIEKVFVREQQRPLTPSRTLIRRMHACAVTVWLCNSVARAKLRRQYTTSWLQSNGLSQVQTEIRDRELHEHRTYSSDRVPLFLTDSEAQNLKTAHRRQ